MAQSKNHLNVTRPWGGSAVKWVLLMYPFVTLLRNKTSGSDKQHFLLHILKNENKEEFFMDNAFSPFELILKSILRKWLSQDAPSNVHLNKYGSYFKFIQLLLGDINLNPGPTTPIRNDMLWELLPFCNCSFSTEQMDYELHSLSQISNDSYNLFQERGTHFIRLNVNSLCLR